jgi:hypothetical protein
MLNPVRSAEQIEHMSLPPRSRRSEGGEGSSPIQKLLCVFEAVLLPTLAIAQRSQQLPQP